MRLEMVQGDVALEMHHRSGDDQQQLTIPNPEKTAPATK